LRRQLPEVEIPTEEPEIQITPPIFEEKEEPIVPEPEKEEIEVPPELEEVKEKEEALSKVATFEERIRGTRIKRTMIRTYSLETSDGEISRMLESQYDSGGNFVMNIKSIDVQATPEYEEQEIERGIPGSADVSP